MVEGALEQFGGYRVVRRIATGGTYDVLLGKAEGTPGFERFVALKIPLARHQGDAAFVRRFASEATAYARLSHGSIACLFDLFSQGGQLVMAVEYVDGVPLGALVAALKGLGEPLPDRAALYVAERVFDALATAHELTDANGHPTPVLHRNLNPSGILVGWNGDVKLSDFGMTRGAGVGEDVVAGVFGYLAPEQLDREELGPPTDVYSAAIVLWELLARRKAILRISDAGSGSARAIAEPRLPSLDVIRPDLDRRLRELLTLALEPDLAKRVVTAASMARVLRDLVAQSSGKSELLSLLQQIRKAHRSKKAHLSLPWLEKDVQQATAAGTSPRTDTRGAPSSSSQPLSRRPAAIDEWEWGPGGSLDLDSLFKEMDLTQTKENRTFPLPVRSGSKGQPKGSNDLTLNAVGVAAFSDALLAARASKSAEESVMQATVPQGKFELPSHARPTERRILAEEPTVASRAPSVEPGSDAARGVEGGESVGSLDSGDFVAEAPLPVIPEAPPVLAPAPPPMAPLLPRATLRLPGLLPAPGVDMPVVRMPPDIPVFEPRSELPSIEPQLAPGGSWSVAGDYPSLAADAFPPRGPSRDRASDPLEDLAADAFPLRGPSRDRAPDPLEETLLSEAVQPLPSPAAEVAPSSVKPPGSERLAEPSEPLVSAPPVQDTPIEPETGEDGIPVDRTPPWRRILIALVFVGCAAGLYVAWARNVAPPGGKDPGVNELVPTPSAPPASAALVPFERPLPSSFPAAEADAEASDGEPASAAPSSAPSASASGLTPKANTAILETAGAAPNHRIFFDGRVVGETPRPVEVPCGTHTVQLGSAGKVRTLELPCGRELSVTDH